VRRRRVEFGEEETSLGSSRVADDVPRDGVSVEEEFLHSSENREEKKSQGKV